MNQLKQIFLSFSALVMLTSCAGQTPTKVEVKKVAEVDIYPGVRKIFSADVSTGQPKRVSACSAIFMTTQVAITAAHCLPAEKSKDNVVLVENSEGETINSIFITVSSGYRSEDLSVKARSDIALIKFDVPVVRQSETINLTGRYESPAGSELVRVGVTGKDPSSLKEVVDTIVTGSNEHFIVTDGVGTQGVSGGALMKGDEAVGLVTRRTSSNLETLSIRFNPRMAEGLILLAESL